MVSNFRQTEILDQARRDGRVTVDGLARQFDVTVQTIRRDLAELAETGKLERVHGGAVIPSGVINIVYEERRRLNAKGKAALARACAERVPDGASVFMNIGTTTEAVARELLDRDNLLVVTNNINIANILSANRGCEIVLAGGQLRHSDGGLVGGFTAELVRHFKFDIAILGCSALDGDGDLLDFDAQEILVSQTAIARARQVFVAADHSKLDRNAPVTICSLADVTALFTDVALPPDLATRARDWGTEVVIGTPPDTRAATVHRLHDPG
ncbi:DeoR/GlpR family DNA-binding transcription regulator [Jannaschia sp. S6380]|uniref:DeoR/GlpR family DNA-binding transcription regulator n=1 Tax=Jannaschia sp. S6380 TaxID=2926408 RepID=UPI001FF50FD4|nr:DeoR/GlpR family DNA-binding transcription regulator [Jannaschia sp. S6380]MCK0168567.1 DeoR/GlpR family DNA-binding transcription regulator [Jannaschia sp. S6380]